MLRHIVLAFNGSPESEKALGWSLDLAQGMGAVLDVVMVVESVRRSAVEVEADRRWAWEMLRDLETGAARACVSLQLDVLNGDVVSTILARAAELPADIISLGHSHQTKLDRLAGRSVADMVLNRAKCAVLLPAA